MNNLREVFEKEFASFSLPDRRDIVDFCLEEIELTNPPYNVSGPLDLSLSRYLIEPLQALQNDRVREVIVAGAPRTGKTLILEAFLLYCLSNDPADILACFHVKNIMRDFYNVRLLPLLAHNKLIDLEDDRFESTQKFIRLPNSTLRLVACQTPNELTNLGARIVLATEAWRYPQGILSHIKGRTNDFPYTKKIYIESQGNNEGTDFHREFVSGHQAHYGFKCPECGKAQKYEIHFKREDGSYGGLNWNTDDYTKPNGKRDVARTLETVRYDCIHCGKPFVEYDKKRLNAHGLYLPQNADAKEEIRSFTWGAMASTNVLFTQVAEKYLNAKREWARGNRQPMIDFYQQELGMFWNERLLHEARELKLGVSESTGETVKGAVRITTADVQLNGNLLYYVIADHSKENKSITLVDYGKTDSFEGLDKINKARGVLEHNCLIDSGAFTTKVQRACVKYGRVVPINGKKAWMGWLATKGGHPKDRKYWNETTKTHTWFSGKKWADVNYGTADNRKISCPWIEFDANTAKDITKLLLDNSHSEYKLFLSPEAMADQEFKDQLNKEHAVMKDGKLIWVLIDENDKENHYFDCLNLQTVAGGLMGQL
jgi:phage terminase large subunit GpA-like protein